ncbi:MAG: hemerythrin domain-containing protein [Polyangiales bacterium]
MTRFDMYRDIHKGIRLAVFSYVNELGSADLSSSETLVKLRNDLDDLVDLLASHADHEDAHITPVLARIAPELTRTLEEEHHAYDARLLGAQRALIACELASPAVRGDLAHRLYLELSSFTSAYLAHMLREEVEANRALWAAFDDERLIQMHDELVASIEPADMAKSLSWILRGANIDTRAALLSGMEAHAPRPVFERVLGLARKVLSPSDVDALEQRLDNARPTTPPSSRAA